MFLCTPCKNYLEKKKFNDMVRLISCGTTTYNSLIDLFPFFTECEKCTDKNYVRPAVYNILYIYRGDNQPSPQS